LVRFHVVFVYFAVLLSADPQTSSIEYQKVDPKLIQQRLEAVVRKLSDRRARLEALFREVGCDGAALTTQKVPGSSEPNVICTLAASDPGGGTIVVGGHYDHVDPGMGAVDDWSGAALLPSLYQSLNRKPRRHRYVFVAFSGEERGLYGSRQYVRSLSESERTSVQAMINLECLGLTPPKVWASRADKRLLTAYAVVVQALGVAPGAVNVDGVGDDDSHPFLDAKIPVLTIHSLTPVTLGILHSARDQVSAIRPEEYYTAYCVAATMLAYLDTFLAPAITE
jgi:hypothetical protein